MIDTAKEYLFKQYGELFSPGAKINVPDGWFWLVSGLCRVLDTYHAGDVNNGPIVIRSIEKRLGTLNLHYKGGNSDMAHIICAVQLISLHVCQACGGIENTGSVVGNEVHTVCEKCCTLEEVFYATQPAANDFTEEALQIINAGLGFMPDSWFKKHLNQLIETITIHNKQRIS